MQVLLEAVIVDAFEGCGVVEVLVHRVRDGGVLAEDVELELVGPPVEVPGAAAANVGILDWAFSHVVVFAEKRGGGKLPEGGWMKKETKLCS